ncbi:MAG: M14 family zinc carboxypeptidase [Bacteroidota bacterium]
MKKNLKFLQIDFNPKNFLLCLVFIMAVFPLTSYSQEVWNYVQNNRTVTYDEAIQFYHSIANNDSRCKIITYGKTDCGRPLELLIINPKKIFERNAIKDQIVILINNGIHPGEPDGIDASIRLVHDWKTGKIKIPDNIVLAIIPVYNIDGALNRSSYTRINQNGPVEAGFRGNARNLDLNRDFIKCDSKNAKSFCQLYQDWDPDIFIDTHVSDGADYSYIMTLIDSQKDKLSPAIRQLMQNSIKPALYASMKKKKIEMIPYVNVFGDDPSKGIAAFYESPRFASGYAALFHCFPFVTETHMLKPFQERVEATYQFLLSSMEVADNNKNEIIIARIKAKENAISETQFYLNWQLDTTLVDSLLFKGYEINTIHSEITGKDRFVFDHNKAYSRNIGFENNYLPTDSVIKPRAYVIPQAWSEVIERLQLNGIEMTEIKNDTMIDAEMYYIENYQTGKSPYEGHYLHSKITTRSDQQHIHCFKGDWIVYTNQWKNRYVIETLEPRAVDGFFAWNFFDAILQQKEWFSDYLFEDIASQMLAHDPQLKVDFESRKQRDIVFANDSWAQLTYLYQKSKYYEKSHLRYPILRIP